MTNEKGVNLFEAYTPHQAIRNHVLNSEKLARKIDGVGQKRNVTVIN